jgi:plasmid stabilization system protein ParE
MSRVVITADAAKGLERCRAFLAEKNSRAASRAAHTIVHTFELLEFEPELGRPLDDIPDLRELIIEFGDAGYVALYQYDMPSDTVFVLAFRHQKEVGY